MKNRILPLVLLVVLCAGLLLPLSVSAVTPLDPGADASLTLCYQKDGNAFADLQIGIFRVAEAFPDGSFRLVEPFAAYPVDIHGITMQEQWNYVAQTLCSYIVAEQVAPDREVKTDANGMACFAALQTGLYFVREAVAENESGTYVFNQFMVYVPTPNLDGSYTYNVEARPKCVSFVPKDQYTVTKLWQDAGYQSSRPAEVTVDIYKDGVLHQTQILSEENNWTYTWYVSGEDQGKWTVAERDVPDRYKVTVQQNGSHFSIINTCQTEPDIPSTGDTFSPVLWMALLCFSGVMLLLLGLYTRRRR